LEEIREKWYTSDEEKILEPYIEECFSYLSPNPLYILECDDQFSKELHGMTIKENQRDKEYIEYWFQIFIRPGHSSNLQHLLASYPLNKLASHILVLIKV